MSYADYTRHRPDPPCYVCGSRKHSADEHFEDEPAPDLPHCQGCGCDVAPGVEYCTADCEEESQ